MLGFAADNFDFKLNLCIINCDTNFYWFYALENKSTDVFYIVLEIFFYPVIFQKNLKVT